MSFTFSSTPPPCEECGYDPVFHFTEKSTVMIDSFLSDIMSPFKRIADIFTPLFNRVIDVTAPVFVNVLSRVGIARLRHEPDPHGSETALSLWAEANRRGIRMREFLLFGLARRLFIAEFKGKSLFFEALPNSGNRQKSLEWIDDKAELKKRFVQAGFPVAKGGSAKTEKEALALFSTLQAPVIAKPHIGSGGRHTMVHIETEEELLKAFRNAKRLSPLVMIEEELSGPVFRPTVIGGKIAAVLRRDPPQVIGDGHSTIRELVDKENENPLRRGPVFADIVLESIPAQKEMVRQHVTPETIPMQGQKIQFHFKVNWGVGGTSWDVTDEVHPINKKLFEDIGEYLGNDIVGIDFMIDDISKPWMEQKRCGVIECNSVPLIGNHHFPYKGAIKDVSGAIWDMAFPESKGK